MFVESRFLDFQIPGFLDFQTGGGGGAGSKQANGQADFWAGEWADRGFWDSTVNSRIHRESRNPLWIQKSIVNPLDVEWNNRVE